MGKADEALQIIHAVGMPRSQQNERSSLVLLALANVESGMSWCSAGQPLLRIVDIMEFMRTRYGKEYAPNTRETVRRRTIHQFEQASIIARNPDDPSRPTNSRSTVYALTDDFLSLIRAYGTPSFAAHLKQFQARHGELAETYQKKRAKSGVSLQLSNGDTVELSPGRHNQLQAAVIEEFAPRFAPGSVLLYLGDTARKDAWVQTESLKKLGIPFDEHGKNPDVILYDETRHWLFVIEAVTSHGPVNPKRFEEIESLLEQCSASRIYVTAFLTRADFRKQCADIAWETEVWIAEAPDHMIHFDGEKFLGPYAPNEKKE